MFDERYEVIVADTPVARRIHHRIRYQVYCLENGFEDPARYPDGEERDEWDEHSVHFIVRDRLSGEWIGAMRLIKPVEGILPIQRAAQLDAQAEPQGAYRKVWELSRTCILREVRRVSTAQVPLAEHRLQARCGDASGHLPRSRKGWSNRINWVAMSRLRSAHLAAIAANRGLRDPVAKPAPRTAEPSCQDARRLNGYEILAGMLRAAIEYTRDQDTYHLYFLINPALARMVKRMQLDIVRVGPGVNHRGIRYPYAANLNEVVFGAVRRSPEMASLFLEGEDPYRYYSKSESSEPSAMIQRDATAA